MSSTKRGSERNEHDYYLTPQKCIKDFWAKFCQVEGVSINDFSTILDPCAGGDKDNECAYPLALASFDTETDPQLKEYRFWTVDIREDSRATYKLDFLNSIIGIHPLIISNPPFELFEEFVAKAFDDVADNGYVIFLLRLNATGGQKRRKRFWNKYSQYLRAIYVHSERPRFTDQGGDSCEYAHFVWYKDSKNDTTETTKFYWV